MLESLLTLFVAFSWVVPAAAGTGAPPVAVAPAAPAPEPAVSARELHARVAPAVVALVVSGGAQPPAVASGVLVTASGLMLTSRRAIADAVDGRATLAMVRSGPRGRMSARDVAGAVPARLVAVSHDLDLALVEAMPAQTVFYPHLPIVRQRSADGTPALAVGHASKGGLWSATMLPLGPVVGPQGAERWMRELPAEVSLVSAGTPLVDGVGRIVALAGQPTTTGVRLAIDAEGLLRFLLAANAPERRFGGIPPIRRPLPGEALTPAAGRAAGGVGAPRPSGGEAARAPRSKPAAAEAEVELPTIVRKRMLDSRFLGTATAAPAAAPVPTPEVRERTMQPVVPFSNDAVSIALATLERHPPPASIVVDAGDAPERGPRSPPVTIVQLGDFHAPETREVEPTLRSLVDGPGAQARLFWRDADRGYGADYHLWARAARAAAEQDEFWPMHDRLLRLAVAPGLDVDRLHKLARELELDAGAFAASLSSDGLASTVETDAVQAGRLPLLCTPAFVVNGRAVDGGTMAAEVLRSAVNEELIRATTPNGVAAVRPAREITPGGPIVGSPLGVEKLARMVTAASSRRAGAPPRRQPVTPAASE